MILSFRRDKRLQWRTFKEKHVKIYIRRRWKEFSEFVFWDCYSYDKKRSFHIWKAETATEKQVAQKEKNEINARLKLIVEENWKLETSMRQMRLKNSEDRKLNWKWDKRYEKVVRKKKNDFDWYRYQKMSFFMKIKKSMIFQMKWDILF